MDVGTRDPFALVEGDHGKIPLPIQVWKHLLLASSPADASPLTELATLLRKSVWGWQIALSAVVTSVLIDVRDLVEMRMGDPKTFRKLISADSDRPVLPNALQRLF